MRKTRHVTWRVSSYIAKKKEKLIFVFEKQIKTIRHAKTIIFLIANCAYKASTAIMTFDAQLLQNSTRLVPIFQILNEQRRIFPQCADLD